MRMAKGERFFNILIVISLLLFAFICIYPFYYVTVLAFNDGTDAMRGGLYFWPRVWTLENFTAIFKDNRLFRSFMISVYRTVVGTVLSVLLSSCFAFALSKRDLPGRKFLNWYLLISMYFSGGFIPYYLVCKALGLTNTLLVYIIPGLIAPFFILLLRVFYLGMDISLEESAVMDGAGYFTVFFRIYFPLSAPSLATVALLTGIGHWNDWFAGTIMVYTNDLWPLQTLLLHIIQGADVSLLLKGPAQEAAMMNRVSPTTPESLKMAMLVITVLPIVMIYPLLQRHFIKGIMIGSLKG